MIDYAEGKKEGIDKSTPIGLLAGVAILIIAILSKSGNIFDFTDIGSFLIVIGGTFCAALVNFPLRIIKSIPKLVIQAFFSYHLEEEKIINHFMRLTEKVRVEGLRTIRPEEDSMGLSFFKSWLDEMLQEDDPLILENKFHADFSRRASYYSTGHNIFLYMGSYAPAFGLLGTVIGLIIMLKAGLITDAGSAGIFNLGQSQTERFSGLLSGMGIALTTTFYGIFISNLIFLPMAGKLRRRFTEDLRQRQFIMTAILYLKSKPHPLEMRDNLFKLLPGALGFRPVIR